MSRISKQLASMVRARNSGKTVNEILADADRYMDSVGDFKRFRFLYPTIKRKFGEWRKPRYRQF